MRELEGELDRAKAEVEAAKRGGEERLREAIGTKSGTCSPSVSHTTTKWTQKEDMNVDVDVFADVCC